MYQHTQRETKACSGIPFLWRGQSDDCTYRSTKQCSFLSAACARVPCGEPIVPDNPEWSAFWGLWIQARQRMVNTDPASGRSF